MQVLEKRRVRECGPKRTYSLLCPSGDTRMLNYLLIPVEGAGFVVIKQILEG